MNKNKETIYMMGICGTAMGSLAGLLRDMGYNVRGSDQNVYPPMSTKLKSLGIDIIEGYKPENLNPRPDKVIVGNVMSKTHAEVQALLDSKIPYTSLPKAMGEFLIKDRHSVVISGTHGKTTTTAIAAWVLEKAGLKPGFMIGGVPLNFPNTFSIGKGNYFVIEGDEYDTAFFDKVPKFIHYRPRSVILTSIEFDHADIYRDLDHVKDAFKMLLKLIPEDGHLIYQSEDENIKSILAETKCKNVQGYGVKSTDWQLGDIKWEEAYSQFDVIYQGKKIDTIKSNLFGEYNLLNALSVYALAYNLKLDLNKVREAFMSFKGVKRRQEIIGQPRHITIIDDFAHHPTAVRVTIGGVKKRFKKSRIIGVFEPRSATSRRRIFQDDFAKALSTADEVIVSVPYDQSKISETQRFNSDELINDIKKIKGDAHATLGHSPDEIISHLKTLAQPGDVILLMSNGGFGGIYQKLLKELI
ncbi:MAG: UDP-N-acetylmuramate:L-alanyl-gamma-D-glutamyl-meso-diaminopimelate ligase [Oligoflexia bacterium]|nr:UDP-N-acetylmuramate:L-alanyl-gamma-D-glutamyl-meso-diaminopimelate ligase [Oligoflexia bacterium]